MLSGLYISAAGLQAQDMRQAVIANNLANAQTNGFKRDLVSMQARLQAPREDVQMMKYLVPTFGNQGGGVNAMGVGMDLAQAPLVETTNQTDVAIEGRGFFTVKGDKEGEKSLTRDGQFLINTDGALVTANGGRPVLSSEGQPIVLIRNCR